MPTTPTVRAELLSAMHALAPLLRKRGTSPEVGRLIRLAVSKLDQTITSPTTTVGQVALLEAVGALKNCMALIQTSTVAADREQLSGAAVALSKLFEVQFPGNAISPATKAASPQTVIVPILPSKTEPSGIVGAGSPLQIRSPVSPASKGSLSGTQRRPLLPVLKMRTGPKMKWQPPSSPTPVVQTKARTLEDRAPLLNSAAKRVASQALPILASLVARRVVALAKQDGPSWRQLLEIDDEADVRVRALKWLDPDPASITRELVAAGEMTEDAPERLVALALAGSAVETLVPSSIAESDDFQGRDLLKGFSDLSWVADGQPSVEAINRAPAFLRPFLLRRAGRRRIDLEALAKLLDDRDEELAATAAELLAWSAPTEWRQFATTKSMQAQSPRLKAALLLFGVALGSPDCLNAVRGVLDAPLADWHANIFQAIAVGGDERDADRLLKVAYGGSSSAEHAVRTIGHLGISATAPNLKALQDRLPIAAASALQAITGPDASSDVVDNVRMLRGHPWSIGRALDVLESPVMSVHQRELLALDIAVRTGVRPPQMYSASSPAKEQAKAAEAWRERYQDRGHQLPAGRWLFVGRTVA